MLRSETRHFNPGITDVVNSKPLSSESDELRHHLQDLHQKIMQFYFLLAAVTLISCDFCALSQLPCRLQLQLWCQKAARRTLVAVEQKPELHGHGVISEADEEASRPKSK